MSAEAGPDIVTDGLVLALDSANIRSFAGEPTVNLRTLNQNGQYPRFNYNNGVYTYEGIETTGPYTGWEKIIATRTSTANRLIMGLNGITATASTTYTATIEFVSINNNLTFNLTGNQGVGDAIRIGNTNRYYRTFTKNATTAAQHWYLASTQGGANFDITDGIIYYRQIQWEQKPYFTPWVNGTRGTTVATGGGWADLSGNTNHGELVNGPTFNSENFGSIVFDAVDDVIRIPNSTTLDTQTPTVEVWIKTNATSQNGFWFEKGTVNTQYSLFQEGSVIQWRHRLTNGTLNSLSTTTANFINTSNWYQVVGTFVSGNRRLYINGTLVNSDTLSGTIATNNGGMSIGAYGGFSGSRGYYYNGNLAICKIYNRALSATEVQQNFNATHNRFGI